MTTDSFNDRPTANDSAAGIARLEQRVAELEMRILHLQRDWSALNEVVVEQARRIDELRLELQTFKERQNYWQEQAGGLDAAEEPPPPHY